MNVLITGASHGLGAELYRVFDARHDSRVKGTTHLPGALRTDMHFWDAEQWLTYDGLRRHVKDDFDDRLDVLINNAGINAICPFERLNPDFIRHIMKVNFEAPVLLTQQMLDAVAAVKGIVVNIISDAAHRPMRHSLAYNCSKAALDMATRQMARELTKPLGITIMGIRPGKMAGTEMSRYIDDSVCRLRGWTPEQAMDYFRQGSVTGNELDPKAVAEIVYDVATNERLRPSLSGTIMDLVG